MHVGRDWRQLLDGERGAVQECENALAGARRRGAEDGHDGVVLDAHLQLDPLQSAQAHGHRRGRQRGQERHVEEAGRKWFEAVVGLAQGRAGRVAGGVLGLAVDRREHGVEDVLGGQDQVIAFGPDDRRIGRGHEELQRPLAPRLDLGIQGVELREQLRQRRRRGPGHRAANGDHRAELLLAGQSLHAHDEALGEPVLGDFQDFLRRGQEARRNALRGHLHALREEAFEHRAHLRLGQDLVRGRLLPRDGVGVQAVEFEQGGQALVGDVAGQRLRGGGRLRERRGSYRDEQRQAHACHAEGRRDSHGAILSWSRDIFRTGNGHPIRGEPVEATILRRRLTASACPA